LKLSVKTIVKAYASLAGMRINIKASAEHPGKNNTFIEGLKGR
jgi:hypothetical protein